MALGQLVSPVPQGQLPFNFPMLAINSLCDGATLTLTLFFLQRIVRQRSILKAGLYIVANILTSIALALLSIVLGTGYEHSAKVSFVQAVNILLLRSSKTHAGFGAHFFLMNSTLIPVLLYLVIILLLYLNKILLYKPFRFAISKVNDDTKPIELLIDINKVLARIFALILVILTAFKVSH